MRDLEHAARVLEWDGHVIPDVEVLGARFAAVARVHADVHRWRRANGWAPELDPTWFRCWSEPRRHDHLPVAAVQLLGVLVPTPDLSRAADACGTLTTLAPCSVVAPADQPYQPWPLTELDYYGIGVVTADESGPAEPVLQPADRSAEFGPSLFARWLLEVLYSKALDSDPEFADS